MSVAVAAGVLMPGGETPAAPLVTPSASPAFHRPQVALAAWTSPGTGPVPPTVLLQEMVAAASAPAPGWQPTAAVEPMADDVVADPAPTPLTPIDVIDAIGAAAYLAVAGPLLVVSIPFQVITGQSEDIVVSLTNLIQAANTILKLVGRSIAPIPVPSAQDVAEASPAVEVAAEDFDDADVHDAEEPETEDSDESVDTDDTEGAEDIEEVDGANETEDSDQTEDTDETKDTDETEDTVENEDTDETEDTDTAETEDTESATDDTEAPDTGAESDTVTG
ncbi:hypothetical protein BCA37_04650 [Mycobacterium sp. djl-10]|nr:hypothetical protein BCA37_04650 [Mycobacterium sp. djl-10]